MSDATPTPSPRANTPRGRRRPLLTWALGACLALSTGFGWATAYVRPEIVQVTLPTGQTVLVQENRNQPIITLDTWVKTGSVNESADNNGVSHFLEHLLFKGTPTHPTGAIDRILEAHGTQFNAATSTDFTHYYLTIPSSFFQDALTLHADMLLNATIAPPELARERLVVQEEINRATDNPDRKLYMALVERLFPGHGYALDTLGPKSLIGSIPRDRILAYYHHWYQPKNLNTIIVGDVDPKVAIASVAKAFPAPTYRPDEQYQPPTLPAIPPLTAPQAAVLEDAAVQHAYTILGVPGPSIDDREASLALDAAMSTLGDGRTGRLYRTLREDQALVTDVGAGNYTLRHAGVLYVSAESAPEKLPQVQTALLNQLQALRQRGITETELQKVKTQALKRFIFQNESTSGVANSIGYNVTIGTLADYTDYVENLQKLTVADVQQALDRYLDLNQAVWVTLLPKDTPAANRPNPDQLVARLEAAAKTAAAPSPAARPLASQPAAIRREVLPNGLTLVTKVIPSAQTAAIKVFARGGQSVEPVPGLSAITATMLMKGTATRSAAALNQALESRGMSLSASTGEDTLHLSGSAVAEDFPQLLGLLTDVLARPTFPAAELIKEKGLMRQGLIASRDNPATRAGETLLTRLYPKHPYGYVGPRVEAGLARIQRSDLVTYWQRASAPRNLVVSAVGRFDPVALKAALLKTWPSAPTATPTGYPPAVVPTVSAPVRAQETPPIQGAAWVARAWAGPPVKHPDHVPLKVLNSLLGSGMSSRLFVNLREKQGLAYAVSSQYPSLRQGGRLVLFLGTDPKNVARVEEGFQTEIDRLVNEAIPAAELTDAKNKLTGTFALAHETPADQAYYLGYYEALGLGYGYDTDYPKQVQQVSAADVQRVAKTYLTRPSVTAVVQPGTPTKTVQRPAG